MADDVLEVSIAPKATEWEECNSQCVAKRQIGAGTKRNESLTQMHAHGVLRSPLTPFRKY